MKGRAYRVRETESASYNSRNLKLFDVLKPSLLSSSLCASLAKKICNAESWQSREDLELRFATSGDVNWYNRYEKPLDGIQQNSIYAIPYNPEVLLVGIIPGNDGCLSPPKTRKRMFTAVLFTLHKTENSLRVLPQ